MYHFNVIALQLCASLPPPQPRALFSPARRRPIRHTILDATDAESIVALVRRIDAGTGSDGLVERLSRVYATFRPTHAYMAHLSLSQQAHASDGGLLGFCYTTLYVAASESINSDVPRVARLARSASCPLLTASALSAL